MIATSRAVGGDDVDDSEEELDVVGTSTCANVGARGRSLCMRNGY